MWNAQSNATQTAVNEVRDEKFPVEGSQNRRSKCTFSASVTLIHKIYIQSISCAYSSRSTHLTFSIVFQVCSYIQSLLIQIESHTEYAGSMHTADLWPIFTPKRSDERIMLKSKGLHTFTPLVGPRSINPYDFHLLEFRSCSRGLTTPN